MSGTVVHHDGHDASPTSVSVDQQLKALFVAKCDGLAPESNAKALIVCAGVLDPPTRFVGRPFHRCHHRAKGWQKQQVERRRTTEEDGSGVVERVQRRRRGRSCGRKGADEGKGSAQWVEDENWKGRVIQGLLVIAVYEQRLRPRM